MLLTLQQSLGSNDDGIITHSVTVSNVTFSVKALVIGRNMYIHVNGQVKQNGRRW